METLEALAHRISTTRDLQSIVRTMKSLSAVSIRQYERAVAALREYSQTIEYGFQVVLRHQPLITGSTDAAAATIAIVFGSDHGLCGRFNEQIADFARTTRDRETGQGGSTRWLAVGLRAASRLEALGTHVDECFYLPGAVNGLDATAHRALLQIDEWRGDDGATRVLVFHNVRSDEATATPRVVQLLPLDPEWLRRLQQRRWEGPSLPIITMDAEQLLAFLVRQYLFVTIYRAGAESMASEHATRLTAMQAAERNINEHLEEMNGQYRHRRQQSITEELLDVVAGFEAVRSFP